MQQLPPNQNVSVSLEGDVPSTTRRSLLTGGAAALGLALSAVQ